jgi:spectinomycin phosphotransferase
VRVVTPAAGFGDNPRAFVDGEGRESVWVVYPFVAGETYRGDAAQIRAAGDLLGRIHAAGASTDFGLKISETVVPVGAGEIAEDMAGIVGWMGQAFPAHADSAVRVLRERSQRYLQQALPRLLATRLPLANCSWDYKAANLVYEAPTLPVLIDPDSGGRIPRAYDLAIAALLFHNEGQGPGRLFTQAEWQHFLQGYRQHVHWTELEEGCWEDILLCAWIDEALWLLREDDEGWRDPKQSEFLLSLLLAPLSTFAISAS